MLSDASELSRNADFSQIPFPIVALPTLSEVPRMRSSRDALHGPLRPLPPSRDAPIRQLLLLSKVESMRDSGQAVEDLEGSDDEELRKAVEVSSRGRAVRYVCGSRRSYFFWRFAAGQFENAVEMADTAGRTSL